MNIEENKSATLNPEMQQPIQANQQRLQTSQEQPIPQQTTQVTQQPNISNNQIYYQGGYNPYSNHSYPPRYYQNYPPQNYYQSGFPQYYGGQSKPQYYPSIQSPNPTMQPQPTQDVNRRQESQYPEVQHGTQPLFRTHNPNQPSQIIIHNSEICGVCEKPGATIKCISACKKFYHKDCVDQMTVKTINQSEQNGSYYIQCENCLARMHRCQHCQQQGQIGLQMVKCSVNSCSYFFHKKCMQKEKENIPQSVAQLQMSPVFLCGSHHCHSCNQPFRIDEQVLRCVKCVVSYHESCKDQAKIHQITSKQFICTSHQNSIEPPKKYNYVDSQGNIIYHDTRQRFMKQQESIDEEGEQEEDNEANQTYKRMRLGLSGIIDSGELLQVQRSAESITINSTFGRGGVSHHGMGGPPSITQSNAQWKRVDPSETIVLNQNTLKKVNDIIQQEILKKTGGSANQQQSLKILERQWIESFEKENAGKSIKRVSKIIKKMQKTDIILEKQKQLFENKFEEFAKYVRGENDNCLLVKMHE